MRRILFIISTCLTRCPVAAATSLSRHQPKRILVKNQAGQHSMKSKTNELSFSCRPILPR